MNPKQKIYFSLAIYGIGGILLIVFLIYPFLRDIKRNSDSLLAEKEKLVLLAKETENLQGLKKVFDDYQSDFDKFNSLLINAEIPVDFYNFLENTAAQSQVEMKKGGASPKETKKDDPWPSISLQLSVAGSFENCLRFIDKLENSPYLIQVLDLNIQKATGETTGLLPSDISIFFTIKVFAR